MPQRFAAEVTRTGCDGALRAAPNGKSVRSRACLVDQLCSLPQCGQRVLRRISGRAPKLISSVSIPTEKSNPVASHFMTTVPIPTPPRLIAAPHHSISPLRVRHNLWLCSLPAIDCRPVNSLQTGVALVLYRRLQIVAGAGAISTRTAPRHRSSDAPAIPGATAVSR